MADEEIIDDVQFDPEDEMGDLASALAKIKKLRAQLKEAQEKRDENLVGWQRCKADSINEKKDGLQAADRRIERAQDAFIEALIPALDSFDMAASGEAWEAVSAEWRAGIGHIQNQLLGVLEQNGVKRFGKSGEVFDPNRHEAVQEVEDGTGESHTILKILRHGYAAKDRVLRPAQVIVRK